MENTFKINEEMMFTAKHMVMTENGLVEAQNLKQGDILINGKDKIKITDVIEYDESKREKAKIIGKTNKS